MLLRFRGPLAFHINDRRASAFSVLNERVNAILLLGKLHWLTEDSTAFVFLSQAYHGNIPKYLYPASRIVNDENCVNSERVVLHALLLPIRYCTKRINVELPRDFKSHYSPRAYPTSNRQTTGVKRP